MIGFSKIKNKPYCYVLATMLSVALVIAVVEYLRVSRMLHIPLCGEASTRPLNSIAYKFAVEAKISYLINLSLVIFCLLRYSASLVLVCLYILFFFENTLMAIKEIFTVGFVYPILQIGAICSVIALCLAMYGIYNFCISPNKTG
jgi:hypothetical protein